MNETYQQQHQPAPYMPMSGKRLMQIALLGVIVGLFIWGISFVLETYVLKALLCNGSLVANCGARGSYGEAAASILAAGIGLFALVRLQVFRPLLVVIATVVSMWGIISMLSVFPWYGAAIASALLYGAAYMLFAWITRLRLFWVVILLLVVVIVGIRLILTT